ncbi:RmlC-like cupin domain-containing protein [Lipomyces arxii]|uniref:RmlC-like cupin domain-containing protein n=1 Tax=Lipomyces arxii TaxID=56418 RepID=UPI0034CD8BB0
MKTVLLIFLLPVLIAYGFFSRSVKTPSEPLATTTDFLKTSDKFYTISEEQMALSNLTRPRAIAKMFTAIEQSEGAGARVRRSVGTAKLRNFSPFLMLDHFFVGGKAGFPDHPHRGQETITYLLHGQFDHEDFTGAAGTIDEGDLQFMTAGRGIMHAEIPRPQKDGSPVTGLQLWVDLPEELKNVEPRYRDLRKTEIPIAAPSDKVEIKVISGQSYGVKSVQDLAYTPVWMFDALIKPGGHVSQELPDGWNAFAYVLEGDVLCGLTKAKQYSNIVLEREGDGVELSVPEEFDTPARVVIIAGKVLDQKVVQYGPFVATSQEKIYEAVMDFQSAANGFERARNWESKIAKMIRN